MSSRPSAFTLTSPGRLRLFSTLELLTLPPPTWLVDGVLPAEAVVGLYGQPGIGKSFVAIDLAMSVATGTPWHGCSITKGYVLYVSAEGGIGIGKRARAWLHAHAITPQACEMAWLTESISVYGDSEDVDVLMDRLHHEVDRYPALIVIDTLARCFDGNENEQEDMGRFIKGVDRLRMAFGSAVLIVHHTRLDGERERGNTAFRGAADTMMALTRDEHHVMTLACTKQKDAEDFAEMRMALREVPGTDSCMVADLARNRDLKRSQVLALLQTAGDPLTFSEWWAHTEGKMSPATFKRILVSLAQTGEIVKENGRYRVEEGS